jgi:hypothetical protein
MPRCTRFVKSEPAVMGKKRLAPAFAAPHRAKECTPISSVFAIPSLLVCFSDEQLAISFLRPYGLGIAEQAAAYYSSESAAGNKS